MVNLDKDKNQKFLLIDVGYATKRATSDSPVMLSYGASAFFKSLSDDVYQDLLAVFDAKEACAMMAIATLQEHRRARLHKRTV